MLVAPVRRRRRASALAAGVLAACLVLAGCSADAPEPAPLESPAGTTEEPSESPEPSAASSDGPPEMPAAAKGTSKKSAEAFVRYAVEVLNYTSRTLDTKPLNLLFAEACTACTSIVAGVRDVAREGGALRGGEWTITRAGTIGETINGQQLVQILARTAPQTVIKSRGAEPVRYQGGNVAYDFRLTSNPRGWKIASITEVSQ